MILAGTVAVVLAGVLVAVVRAWGRTCAQLSAARAELVHCAEHLAAAAAEDERLRQLVDAQIQLRAEDFETFRADIHELRQNYEQTIEQYRLTFGRSAIDSARSRRRIH